MGALMSRQQFNRTVALKTSEGAAGYIPIPFADYAGGKVYIPAGSSITTLTFYSARGVAGQDEPGQTPYALTFTQCRDASNANLSLTVAAGFNYPLPTELFGDGTIEIVADAAGNVDISLKA